MSKVGEDKDHQGAMIRPESLLASLANGYAIAKIVAII